MSVLRGSFYLTFKKLVVRALSGLEHSAIVSCLKSDKAALLLVFKYNIKNEQECFFGFEILGDSRVFLLDEARTVSFLYDFRDEPHDTLICEGSSTIMFCKTQKFEEKRKRVFITFKDTTR